MSQTEMPRTDRSGRPVKLTRRGHLRKWDREPSPHDWRFFIGSLGKMLIAVGLLMFGFVAYQLYGTGIETAAAQNELSTEFEQQLAEVQAGTLQPGQVEPITTDPVEPITTDPTEPITTDAAEPITTDAVEPVTTDDGVVPAAAQILPVDLQDGDALAQIQIPKIGLDNIVVAGVDRDDLKRGTGHYPDTPLPGQLGNSAIAGHRTTSGQPFRNVDQLAVGDEIRVTTLNGVFVYRVTGQTIVSPQDYQVVATTDPTKATLTLTSCHPVFTARQRIVIFSELDVAASSAVGEATPDYGRQPSSDATSSDSGDEELVDDPIIEADPVPSALPGAATETDPGAEIETDAGTNTGTSTGTDSGVETGTDSRAETGSNTGGDASSESAGAGIEDAFSETWFSDPAANPQVGMWGLALGVIALLAYAISRRFRSDLLGLAIGIVPFAVSLYFFFQNVNRLLPLGL